MRDATHVLLLALLFATGAGAEDLTAERIKALVKLKDDRSRVPKQLRLYPMASEFEVTVRAGKPGELGEPGKPMVVREKLVEAKYLISLFQPPGVEGEIAMVVFFDEKDDCYRKFVLLPNGTVDSAIGTGLPGTRSLSWVFNRPDGEILLGHEQHGVRESRWTEVVVVDGKVVWKMTGVAKVKKRP